MPAVTSASGDVNVNSRGGPGQPGRGEDIGVKAVFLCEGLVDFSFEQAVGAGRTVRPAAASGAFLPTLTAFRESSAIAL